MFVRGLTLLFVMLASVVHARADEPKLLDEAWDAVYMEGEKIGYVHSVARAVKEGDRSLVHLQADSVMSMKRFGQTVEMKQQMNSYETPEGKLVRFETRTLASQFEMYSRGEVAGKQLKLTVRSFGKETTPTVPWSDDLVAPYAEEQLKHKKLKPGEQLVYRMFVPDLNRVAQVTLTGAEPEETELLASKRKLRRVRSEMRLEGDKNPKPFLKGIEWLDEHDEALKRFVDTMSMTTYRVTKEFALAKPAELTKDIGLKTLVKVTQKIPRPYEATEIVYQLQLKDDTPDQVFPSDGHQSLSKAEDGRWLLAVRSIEPGKPSGDLIPAAPEFLGSNNYLQLENEKIKKFAADAVGKELDPWTKALLIEKWVSKNLTQKNYAVPLATAAEVAENLAGDCTEHAVLLAALARVAGVPSRVAVGLVYAESLGAFGGHMWTEVYVNGKWIPLDGTLGRGFVGGTHIKLADASLDGADATVAFVPVTRVLDKLKIDVVSWKHPEKK
jgi:hypothetical protein